MGHRDVCLSHSKSYSQPLSCDPSLRKVSQGFDNVEWPATAMKLKLSERSRRLSSPMSALKRTNGADPEGLEFVDIAFSPNGKFLAALAAPSPAPNHTQVRRPCKAVRILLQHVHGVKDI